MKYMISNVSAKKSEKSPFTYLADILNRVRMNSSDLRFNLSSAIMVSRVIIFGHRGEKVDIACLSGRDYLGLLSA